MALRIESVQSIDPSLARTVIRDLEIASRELRRPDAGSHRGFGIEIHAAGNERCRGAGKKCSSSHNSI